MLHDVLGGEPRPRGHGRELREGRRGRVLGMQDDRAFEAPGLRIAYTTISLHARTISASTGKCGLPISPKATALRSRMWFAARSIARFIASTAGSWPSVSRKSMNSTGYGPSATNTWRRVAARTASAIG